MKTILLSFFFLFSCTDKSEESPSRSISSSGPVETSKSNENLNPPPAPTSPQVSAPGSTDPAPTSVPAFTAEFLRLINAYRTSVGNRALILDPGLSLIAQEHSEDMATQRLPFGHDGFSNRCYEGYRVLGGGSRCGENVAAG